MDPKDAPDFEDYLRWRSVLDDPSIECDFAHAGLTQEGLAQNEPLLVSALDAMVELEGGAIANADENRMVGHYWLRAPARAPDPQISEVIATTMGAVEEFAAKVRRGQITPPEGGTFRKAVVVGIGGSALGPMLLVDALAERSEGLELAFVDNTDPDGIDRLIDRLGSLQDVLIVVISKSGGTKETRNGMLELRHACEAQELLFAARAVAVSGNGSTLWNLAKDEGWIATLPMWDWVGGRTSLWSAVGQLPAALAGLDVRRLLAGAAAMDEATRRRELQENPAAMLAHYWHVQGNGRGERAMVVLPYKDRLLLTSRYLQQLVMESLGKRLDRNGNEVLQGIAVYGNKGSTDQHAFVQQLRDGRHDFFVVFVRVLQDRAGPSMAVEEGVTSGDYLDGFWQGTRTALYESGRASATITLGTLDEGSLGGLLALFERAVGLYAELVNVNAYHQPGVEAGKKAAALVLERQAKLWTALSSTPRTCAELAAAVDEPELAIWPVLQHLAANRPDVRGDGHQDPREVRFRRL